MTEAAPTPPEHAPPPDDAPPFIGAERRGDVVWLTLQRPARLNAIHLAMRDELWTQLELLRDDSSVRVAVITGAGERAFSAGADITEFGSAPSVVEARQARLDRDLWGLLVSLSLPLVAAIGGFAYGAGLELSLYCDLRIAADDARFAIPEVTLGYIPSAGGTQTVARHAPLGAALRMTTSGEPIDAARAHALGLVHAVVSRAELLPTAAAWATQLAALPPAALRAAKRALVDGLDLPLADGLALE
ncbi:MAG: enoyl-CoA hydratase/isomerase family protein, partial [Chloroflexi bacterium]|nr:enoyl-CoA hydratase/isomerase family protein [Chloroflexota bacterium]